MATDRELLKLAQVGALNTAPLAAAATGVVGEANQESFVFITFAAAPYVEQGIVMKKKCRVKTATAVSATTLGADATNNITMTVAKRDGIGGAATTIAAATTDVAGGALTAFTPKTLTVTDTAVEIAAGGVLTFKTVDNGTTTEPLLSCNIVVEYV